MKKVLGLLLSLLLVLPLSVGLSDQPVQAVSGGELISLVNGQRAAAGLPGLGYSGALGVAAQNKAADMIARGYFAHTAPDGTTPWVFIARAGYSYSYAGENLARGFATSLGVVNGWMASPTHRANVLSSNFTQAGFGVASGVMGGVSTTVTVGFFARPAGYVAPAPPPAPRPPVVAAPRPATPAPSAPVPSAAPKVATPTPTAAPSPSTEAPQPSKDTKQSARKSKVFKQPSVDDIPKLAKKVHPKVVNQPAWRPFLELVLPLSNLLTGRAPTR